MLAAQTLERRPDEELANVVSAYGGILRFPSPRYDLRIEIRSRTTRDVYTVAHSVESDELTCGCPDWVFRHAAKGPHYLCKHLIDWAPLMRRALQMQPTTEALAPPPGVWL